MLLLRLIYAIFSFSLTRANFCNESNDLYTLLPPHKMLHYRHDFFYKQLATDSWTM